MHKSIVLLVFMFFLSASAEASVPDMVCQEVATVTIETSNLGTRLSNDQVQMRFKNQNLYLSSPSRSEYLYSPVTEQKFQRFISGNKTIIFESGDTDSQHGTVVHSDEVEVRVIKIHCIHSKWI